MRTLVLASFGSVPVLAQSEGGGMTEDAWVIIGVCAALLGVILTTWYASRTNIWPSTWNREAQDQNQPQPEQKQPQPEQKQPEISNAKALLFIAALIGIPILGIWLFPTVTAGILIFGSVLVFFLSVFRMAVPGIVLSVLMFVAGGALLPDSDSEPTRVDRTPAPRTAPAPEPEMDQGNQIQPTRQFGDWFASGTQAGIDRGSGGGFIIHKEDDLCHFLVSAPPTVTGPYFVVQFEWNNGATDLFELGIHRTEEFDMDFYALYDLPITPGYSMLMPKIRRLSSVRLNGGPWVSLIGSTDALDYLGC